MDAVRQLKAIDRVQNEGGEGYSQHESACERLHDQHFGGIKALRRELFAAEWTAEILEQRRAEWNDAVKPWIVARKNPSTKELLALQDRLGYSLADIKLAKDLHGGK
jgi:hypothetical protein